MEEFNDIKCVSQPTNFKRILYKHQLAAIYKLEQLELVKKIKNNYRYIDTDIGIFSDITGYGKTSSMIGVIVRDKMVWDLSNNYIHTSLHSMVGDGRIKLYQDTEYQKINCTLIIANQSIIRQWSDEFKLTDLKVEMVTTKLRCSKIDPEDYDVVLCSPTMYNRYTDLNRQYAWKRIIFDEPTHTKIPAMNIVYSSFVWFITATPYLLLDRNYSRCDNFLSNLFNSSTPDIIFSNIIVKNPNDFVKLSCKLPDITHDYYTCYEPIVNIVNGFINSNIITMIKAGDIQNAVKSLGGKETDNIHELVKRRKLEDLDEINMRITRYERRDDSENLELCKKRKIEIENNIKELDERFQNALNDICNICLTKLDKPILLSCCQNMFCGKCILKWLETKTTCPLCRSDITSDNIIYVNQEKIKKKPVKKQKSRNDFVHEILKKNKKGKFIIFSSHDKTYDNIKHICNDLKFKISSISGTVEKRTNIIDQYKNGDIDVIFLNSNNNGAGINLQETTDIILYHKMSEDLETQIIGRANRIGRTNTLKIHHLI